MTLDPDLRPAVGRAVLTALILAMAPALVAAAPPGGGLQPVKRHPSAHPAPMTTAQIQIARLRQTADQLRLLAHQPLPANLHAEARAEFARHEQWLRHAGYRVATLADSWEQRLRPLAATARTEEIARALDLNAFFEAQTVGLQSKLRAESSGSAFAFEPVRAAHDTAKVIINQMN